MFSWLLVAVVVLFEADDNKNNIKHIHICKKHIQTCTIWLEVSVDLQGVLLHPLAVKVLRHNILNKPSKVQIWLFGLRMSRYVKSLFRHYPSKLSFETTCCYNMLVDIALQVHLRINSINKAFIWRVFFLRQHQGDVSGHHIWPPKQLANTPF